MRILATSFLLGCFATSVHADDLRTAVGKTDLSTKACAEKAGDVFSAQGATVTYSENIADWSDEKSGSLTVQALLGSDAASVMCHPFESDMVIFVSYSGVESPLNTKAVWDLFYK